MGKINAFDIVYLSETRIFTPGQSVFGSVILDIDKPIEARSINLHVVGKAYTDWMCHNHSRLNIGGATIIITRRPEIQNIRGVVNYLNNKYVLWNGNEHGKVLDAGKHEFIFSFPLPDDCPPVFEGTFGFIRYYCKAVIDRPWKFNNNVISGFKVLPHVDLQITPRTMSPITKEIAKNLGAIFKDGIVNVKITLQKSGYIPGEHIEISLDVSNESSTSIDFVEAKLVEISTFRGVCSHSTKHSSKKESERTVQKVKEELKIEPKTIKRANFYLHVPAVVPSFKNCSVIHVEYELEVSIDAAGILNNSINFHFPILIGTVSSTPPTIHPIEDCPPSYFESLGPPEYYELPRSSSFEREISILPPSYEECMFNVENMVLNGDTRENIEYRIV